MKALISQSPSTGLNPPTWSNKTSAPDLRHDQGFTLIELLVTISIIAILSALLLPGLHRAKGTARKVKCISNLRQIATAQKMYVDDFEVYPTYHYEWQGRSYWWPDLLTPYARAGWMNDLYRCPGNRLANEPLNPGPNQTGVGPHGNYDLNTVGVFWGGIPAGGDREIRESSSIGLGGMDRPREQRFTPLRESKVTQPTLKLSFGDALIGNSWVGGWFGVSKFYLAKSFYLRSDRARLHDNRHNALWNVSFCDSHVESLKTAQLFERSAAALARWNYDNKPHFEFVAPEQ